MSRRRTIRRRLLLAAAAVALTLGAAVTAYAYLTASGRGNGSAAVGSLSAPTIASATPGAGKVTLQWSAVTAPSSGSVAYYVRRDGGAASAACGSAASPIAATRCVDSPVANGRHTYTVTAVWRTWSGTSASASATVSWGVATQLVFTTQPGGSPTGGVAFPTQPVVTARDASGVTVGDYAGTVSLAIQSGGTRGAVLSGCGGTLVNGVTTFSGCKIDRSGSGYVLRASDGTLSVDATAFNVAVGPAAQLQFTTQPGNGTGGSALATQPVVTALDAGGNVVTGYSGTTTLSIAPGTGAGDAVLSNCSSRRSNGVVTFSNCEVDRAGTGYKLRATDATLASPSADSATFNVTVGSLDDIVFTTQPGGGATGGLAFPTQPVVTAVDAGGNTVTSYSSTVSLSIQSGPRSSSLSGCRSSRVNGVVSFAGCELDKAGTYVLRATDSGFRSDDSDSFTVAVGPAAQLLFTSAPSSATAGTAFSTQPVVIAADAGGNTVSGYAGTVSLSISPGTGTAGATLSGCRGTLASGTTTFSGCRIDRSGSGYKLRADDGTVTGDSSTFTVSAGSVSTIAFTTQPSGATGGTAFTTQPVVTAFDALGNVATSYSSTITLSILSGGARGATLSGCSSNRSNGVTTFSGCRINLAGTGYVLRATDTGSRTADATAFDVTAGRAASLLMSAASTTITAGGSTSLTIRALDAGGNLATSYTGSKSLTFGGAVRSPSGASPTVTNGSGSAIAFGSATAITFSAGVATVSGGSNGVMTLRDDGTDSITVTDGTIDEGSDALDMTISTGSAARLGFTSVSVSAGSLSSPCLFTCTNSGVNSGDTFQARIAVTDSEGNTVSGVGSGHTVAVRVDGGSGGSVTSGSSLTISSSGSAISTSSFTFRAQTFGSWTVNSFNASTSAGTSYTTATASLLN